MKHADGCEGNGEMKLSRPCWMIFAWLLLSLCLAPMASADPEPRSIRQWVHESSMSRHDAPTDVTSIAQTTDEFLWIVTTRGLYRFDRIHAVAIAATRGFLEL